MGAGQAVGVLEVAAVLGPLELLVGEGVEHELAGEAEQVERARTVVRDEGSRRPPVLAEHDLLLVEGAVVGVGVLPAGVVDERLLTRRHRGDVEGPHALAQPRIGVPDDPFGRLDHVRIGVVDRATGRVRHVPEA